MRQKGFLLVLTALFLGICFLMASPFLGYILMGLILGFLLLPTKRRLEDYMPSQYSSATVVLLTVLVAIFPLMVLLGFVADDASALVDSVNQTEIDFSGLEQQIEQGTGMEVSLEERVKSLMSAAGSYIVSSTSQIVGVASSVAIGLSIMLFVEFYSLKDGRSLVDWSKRFDLMPTSVQQDLYRDAAKATKAVVKGHIFIAIVTGIVTALGLFLVGIPNTFFWSFIAILAGFIPIIGTALIWVPAAAYLLLQGSTASAIALTLYGLVIVGGVENFVRPYLVDADAGPHPLYILLGVIGGLEIFGMVGIFIGPIIFGVTNSLLVIYQQNLDKFS
jgi:predicted PurR-regulated permease PerM